MITIHFIDMYTNVKTESATKHLTSVQHFKGGEQIKK